MRLLLRYRAYPLNIQFLLILLKILITKIARTFHKKRFKQKESIDSTSMRPTSFALPNISMIHSDRSLVDLKNQYSILNRFQCKDTLSSYSLELDLKLPKLNNRLKTINEKENQLKDKENKMLDQKYMLNSFSKQIQDMKKYLLQNTNRCYCNCNSLRMSQIYPYQQMIQHQCHHNCSCHQKNLSVKSNENNSQKTIPKSKTQQMKKKRGKTFRKYAYAVYFCLFLKHFSSKFTKNRYDFFKQRYLKNDGQKVKQDSYRITKSLEVVDLVKILIQSSPSISQISSLILSSQNQISSTRLIPKKNEDKFKKALNFVNLYLKEMQKVVLSQKFIEFYGQIIGIGTIKQAFFMDDLMIPQQIQFITFSEKKGFAMISPETQNILITIYVFIKHILFKILLKIREKKYLEQKLKGQYEEFIDQSDQLYDFIELASALLYRTVNNLFLDYLEEKSVKTNYDKLRKRFKVSPAKNLAAPGCPNELKQTVNYKELILGVKRIKEAEYFCQNSAFDQYLNYLSAKISQISSNLLQKVRQVNAVIYNHIKQQTLNQSYLIFEGIKNEQNAKLKTGKTFNQLNPLPVKSRALFNPVSKSNIKLSNTSLGNKSKLNNMDNSKNVTKSKFIS